MNNFTKNDQEKANIAILFDVPLALSEVAKVMDYGAKKYDRKNWVLVDNQERYESASLRHQISFHNGEYLDEESGLQHLAHSICSQLFLLEIKLREKKNVSK
jgi:hypothetical protein